MNLIIKCWLNFISGIRGCSYGQSWDANGRQKEQNLRKKHGARPGPGPGVAPVPASVPSGDEKLLLFLRKRTADLELTRSGPGHDLAQTWSQPDLGLVWTW